MTSLILATLLFSPFPGTPGDGDGDKSTANKAKLEGTWTVVSMEKDGQPQEDCKNSQVTIKDNMITFEAKDNKDNKDGKRQKNMRLEFANQGKIRVTEVDAVSSSNDSAGAKEGVYVLTNDFLAVCVHADKSTQNTNENAAGSTSISPTNKSRCTVVLQRASRSR